MKLERIELNGRSANVGRAVGRALVLARLPRPDEEIDVSPGDILVVHNMTPDMIVKVIGIGGVVAEVGGVASHAATLAREFGIPCIVGIQNATSLVPNGVRIELDGDNGTVSFRIAVTS